MNGNAIVGWLKQHWLIVVLGVVALAALPTAWYFANEMNTGVVTAYQTKVSNDFKGIEGSAAKVNYSVFGPDGNKILEKSGEANQIMIDKYGEIWATIKDKTGTISEKGLAFNKSDHGLLTENLFPKPNELDAPVKGREFVRAYIDFHPKILAEAHAGGPPAPEQIIQQLNDYKMQQIDRIKAEQGREPTPEETKEMGDKMMGMRIARLTSRAGEIGVYATPGIFDGVPTDVPNQAPTLARLWDYQERAWIHHDIMRAVTRANGGSSAGVPMSVVKRVSKVSVRAATWDSGDGRPPVHSTEAGEDRVPVDFSQSITGRVSGYGSKNKWYDLRTVDVDVVISSKRLPQFIDALSATNFMSVLNMSMTRVEPLNDLREGYFYGDEHVVKASFVIEYVLLREWRKAWMPDDVQKTLGMVEGVSADDPSAAPAGRSAPPPARAPAARPPAGAAPGGAGPRGGKRGVGGGDD
jgi:hypothetical protein